MMEQAYQEDLKITLSLFLCAGLSAGRNRRTAEKTGCVVPGQELPDRSGGQ